MVKKPFQKSYKGSLVKRLSKESLDTLGKYSSDCDEAILLLSTELEGLKNQSGTTSPIPISSTGLCRWDEKKLKQIVKEAMDTSLEPFIGR